jgi:hypothetical protein
MSSVVGAVLIAMSVAGCQAFRPNPGRFQAWVAAAHAGQFHRAFHRWPTEIGELAALDCPRFDEALDVGPPMIDASLPPIRADVCAFLVEFPYRIEMVAVGRNLGMAFWRADGTVVCKLRVALPSNEAAAALSPAVKIHTTAFSCPGEGEFR